MAKNETGAPTSYEQGIIEKYRKYEPYFGSWYIKSYIGEGSFAHVFEIVRSDFGLEQHSALKIVHVASDKSQIAQMKAEGMTEQDIHESLRASAKDAIKEIRMMDVLKGARNIVYYEDHEIKELPNNQGYDVIIRMELLSSLTKYLAQKNGSIAKKEIARLGIDICRALEECQKNNIIHRDIKTANIFVNASGDFKLGDFGVARMIEKNDVNLSKKGTYSFMAPEVYKGQVYALTADIYSLGIVMYTLLNFNRQPFMPAGSAITNDDRERAMIKRMSGDSELPMPSECESCGLADAVLKACSYSPEDRYQTPGEMREALERLLTDEPEDMENHVRIPKFDLGTLQTSAGDETKKVNYKSDGEGKKKLCRSCHKPISIYAEYCPECGALQKEKKIDSKKLIKIGGIAAACVVLIAGFVFIMTRKGTSDSDKIINNNDTTKSAEKSNSQTSSYQTHYFVNQIDNKPIFEEYRSAEKVTFRDTLSGTPNDAKDISEEHDGSVKVWMIGNEMIIAADGRTGAKDCRMLFAEFTNLKEIDFGGNFRTTGAVRMGYMFYHCSSLSSIDLSAFRTTKVTDFEGMFSGCSSLKSLDLSRFSTPAAENTAFMFKDCSSLEALNLSSFDTSNVTQMYDMFEGCSSLKELDISSFNTSKCESIESMFRECKSLKQIDVSGFDTSSVKSMYAMFWNCESLTGVDVSGFDTTNVEKMGFMFGGCKALSAIDLMNFNTANTTSLERMFSGCTSLVTIRMDESKFVIRDDCNSTDMYAGCSLLNPAGLPGWNGWSAENNSSGTASSNPDSGTAASATSSKSESETTQPSANAGGDERPEIEKMSATMYATIALNVRSGPSTDFDRLGAIAEGEKVQVTGKSGDWYMIDYNGQQGFVSGSYLTTEQPKQQTQKTKQTSGLSTNESLEEYQEKMLSAMGLMLSDNDKKKIKTITFYSSMEKAPSNATDISQSGNGSVVIWRDSNYNCFVASDGGVRPYYSKNYCSLISFFEGFESLEEVNFNNSFNTSEVTNMYSMFSKCSNLKKVNFSGIDTSKVTDMGFMFQGCSSLESLDLSNFDTSNLTAMAGMFYECAKLKSVDLNAFDTSKATTMTLMFCGCTSLKSIDLSGFNTSKVTDMSFMFNDCTSLKSLDLSNFNTSKADNMEYMFSGCTNLTSLDISGFDTSKVTKLKCMFSLCKNLENLKISRNFVIVPEAETNDMYYGCDKLEGNGDLPRPYDYD